MSHNSVWFHNDTKPDLGDKICFVLINSKEIRYGTFVTDGVSTPDEVIPWSRVYLWKHEVIS